MALSMRNPKRKTEQERCYKGIQLVYMKLERAWGVERARINYKGVGV